MGVENLEDEEAYSLLPRQEAHSSTCQCSSASPTLTKRAVYFNVGLCLFSSIITMLFAMYYLPQLRRTVSKNALEEITFYSPVLNELQPNWGPKKLSTLPLASEESIYRRPPPNPEGDAAWDRVSDVGVLHVSREEIIRLGKDPSTTVKAPESWGVGSDRHLVQLDGIHLVHCLDSMRKSLYWNYEYYHPDGIAVSYHSHLSHCMNALLQHLLCKPSVELISYNWVKGQKHPFPDFDINHQCWDYEQLLAWQERHRIPGMEERWSKITRAEDEKLLTWPLLMLEAYNVTAEEAEAMHHYRS
ncbi:hypothetical protein UA08_07365 [Talaromyces atroroseus]|uniref:Tat pathway signal sequence n=1 Tax=Talaromyces atroroseus TaxID=1441469 RepID=A0A225AUQ7_TALAT|nr:hypothetical protein UA08_07365 [Talaromyces atroroseus]OKL57207.1 hypothetical protein UA08_07365 [Talaromyces atroroseus]